MIPFISQYMGSLKLKAMKSDDGLYWSLYTFQEVSYQTKITRSLQPFWVYTRPNHCTAAWLNISCKFLCLYLIHYKQTYMLIQVWNRRTFCFDDLGFEVCTHVIFSRSFKELFRCWDLTIPKIISVKHDKNIRDVLRFTRSITIKSGHRKDQEALYVDPGPWTPPPPPPPLGN